MTQGDVVVADETGTEEHVVTHTVGAVVSNDEVTVGNANVPVPVPYVDEPEPRNREFEVRLCQLALKHKWSHDAFRDMLCLLNEQDSVPALPRDPRTLLGTPRRVNVKNLNADGSQQYYHFGLTQCLGVVLKKWPECLQDGVTLDLQLNMDGLPVANSNRANVHPILGRIIHRPHFQSAVFCIGVYFGKHTKPNDSHMLMSEFNDDFQAHKDTGYVVGDKRVFLNIAAVICDRVERDLIKDTKSHAGYGGCDKCEVHGLDEGSVVFTELNAPVRTDESFWSRRHAEHHHDEKKIDRPVRSSFELLGLGMISKFPLDIMHMVFLGVMKRLITQWYSSKRNNLRMGPLQQMQVNRNMRLNAKTCPSNFQRIPRELLYYKQFKATEFRFFLLYVGPVVLQSNLNKSGSQYKNFMLLVAGMRILLNDDLLTQFRQTASEFLTAFVMGFRDIYGNYQMCYNVHAMIHLAEDARLHGNLTHVNAFPFENHLGKMRKQLRRPGWTLQQLVKREYEQRNIAVKAEALWHVEPDENVNTLKLLVPARGEGPLPEGVDRNNVVEYKSVRVNGVRYSTCPRDKVVKCGGRIGEIRNIVSDSSVVATNAYACVSFYKNVKEFYTFPLCMSKVGFTEVYSLSKRVRRVEFTDLTKMWLVRRSDGRQVAVELLHEK